VNTLAKHTKANRDFFAPGQSPSKSTWLDWIDREVVQGVIIDNKPWVDLNWFAANKVMAAPEVNSDYDQALELLTG